MRYPHPMQEIVLDAVNTPRFRENRIVRELLDFATEHGFGLNEIARRGFSKDDQEQLAQLIGYSVSGFGDLSYANTEVVNKADTIAGELRKEAR